MDQNKPARFLDTAYNALKANPNATNQILQAAAKGAPVGLRGLAAAAAQQNQQEAQKAMAAQQMQAQGPQASVIQKLASMPGIMGQLPASMQLASAPTGPAPEEMPQQMMATGGLVSFADGGNVLPPDVIDAIQSHFAEGGEVRGFAGGEDVDISEALRRALGWGTTDKSVSAKEMAELERIIAGQRIPMGLEEAAGAYNPAPLSRMTAQMAEGYVPELSMTDKMAKSARAYNPQPYSFSGPHANYPTAPRTMERLAEVGKISPEAESYLSRMGSTLPDLAPIEEKLAPAIKGLGYLKFLNPVGDIAMALTPTEAGANADIPYYYPGEGLSPSEAPGSFLTRAEDFAPTDMYNPEKAVGDSDKRGKETPATQPVTWKPEPHDGHEVNPRPRMIEESTKLDKPFEQAKTDVPSAAVTPKSEELGLGALGMEEARDLIANLRGHRTLDPAMAAKLEDLQSSARTSTILQSLLGGLAGGLSNPYGGRYALGSAALGALGGYQKGSTGEEEIGRQAFNILRGYADAPAEEQAAAADKLLGIKEKAAERQSAQDIAEAKGYDALYKAILQGGFARERANIYAGATQGKLEQTNMKLAEDEYNDWLSQRAKELRRPTDEEKANKRLEFYRKYNIENLLSSMGGGALGGGNMGAGTPAPIILRKSQ